MANEEHLAILRQGWRVWNAWRMENNTVRPDLIEANLHRADLSEVNLSRANLSRATLDRADLAYADLSEANLHQANLIEADLVWANLSKASLSSAVLEAADFSWANLSEADLREADLIGANLYRADLSLADLYLANFEDTHLNDLDLRTAKGLEKVIHSGPSSIGMNTLYRSKGQIPDIFLRGCGLPDSFIKYLPSLIGALQPLQYYSCFISYSGANEEFARRLHERMQQAGLRVWFAPHDLKGGRKLYDQIDDAIRIYDKLILVLSESSICSGWVETELRKAFEKERRENRRTLFPIGLVEYATLESWRLPDSSSGKDLAEEVRGYFVPDFSQWKEHDAFEAAFARLLADLKVSTEVR